MPITFAHPAAVLPFARHLPLAALVAGSVAPDAVYYLPISLSGTTTHSLIGVACWDLLIGLALLLDFRVSEEPLRALVPFSLGRQPDSMTVRTAVLTVAAVALGAATHVVWDSFTQTNGFAVENWSLLRTSVVEPHKTYNVVGYISSVAGTALLAYLIVHRARRTERVRPNRAVVAVLLAAPVLGAVLAIDDPIAQISTYDLVRHAIVGAVQAAASAWAIYAVLWHIRAIRPGFLFSRPVRRR
ncbi:DUF4184 family protein [Nocardia sp. NPDC058640]|uniref:DUF4184 family protein n=1 Tax=Nocardia sp. NPDC058640 TaxID=3346571 RepID=UPI00364F7148